MASSDFSALTVSELLTGDKHELVAKAEAKIHYRLGLVSIDKKTSTIIVLIGLYFGESNSDESGKALKSLGVEVRTNPLESIIAHIKCKSGGFCVDFENGTNCMETAAFKSSFPMLVDTLFQCAAFDGFVVHPHHLFKCMFNESSNLFDKFEAVSTWR